MEARRKSPQERQQGKKHKQLLNYTEKVCKSNSAVKCVDERGTMKVRVNLSHKSSVPAFFSPSAWKNHRCMWMAPKRKISTKNHLGYHSTNTPLGKEPKVPSELLNFLLPRIGRKALWKLLSQSWKGISHDILPLLLKQMKLPYRTALP